MFQGSFFFLSNIRTPQHVHVWVHIHAVTHTHLPTPEGHAGYKQLPAAVASASALTLLHPSAHSSQPANSTKKDLAKDFLKFTLTEHAMPTFTKHIGLSRPYSYDLEDGVYEQLTPFGQNFWDLVTNENSKIYYGTNAHPFKSVTTFFGTYEWTWGATINGSKYVDPYLLFLNNKSVTVADYIAGMKQRYNATNYTNEYTIWLNGQN